MYLATVPGCCTRKTVGYAIGATARGTSPGLRGDRHGGPQVPDEEREDDPPPPGRGSQYTSTQLADHLKGYGTRPSVGRTGVCWDNAWAESFNATLKNERAHANGVPHETQGHQRYCLPGRAWYTSQTRLHSALGYRTQGEAEHDFVSSNKAA